jgi:hypothetical protein
MPTFAALINEAEVRFRAARRAAEVARAASKASPADAGLRFDSQVASDDAAAAGREVTRWKFEQALDEWIDDSAAGSVIPDETLLAFAARDRNGDIVDFYHLAAMHLVRDGWVVPKGWRSFTGEAVNNDISTKSNPSAHASGPAAA